MELTQDAIQQKITLGLQAEQLLESEFFAVVVNGLIDKHTQGIIDSQPKDVAERERLFYAIRALKEVYTEVKTLIGDKAYTMALLDQEETNTQPDEE